jgi:hypothetical protein
MWVSGNGLHAPNWLINFCGLFYETCHFRLLRRLYDHWLIVSGNYLKERACDIIEVIPLHFSGRRTSIRIAGITIETWKVDVQNIKLQCYRNTVLLGLKLYSSVCYWIQLALSLNKITPLPRSYLLSSNHRVTNITVNITTTVLC